MRRLVTLLGVTGALAVAGVTHPALPGAERVPVAAQALLAPAYDVVTQSDLRNLAMALQLEALATGDLTGLGPADLAELGWTSSGTSAVTIWVAGDRFLVVARDTRPGASAFTVANGPEGLAVRPLADGATLPGAVRVDVGVTVVPVGSL
jgi:hypothetical protein